MIALLQMDRFVVCTHTAWVVRVDNKKKKNEQSVRAVRSQLFGGWKKQGLCYFDRAV